MWGTAFFALELPAHWDRTPWPTLSSTVWDGIEWWHPVAYWVVLFTLVLLGHFEFEWSAGWLVLLAVLGSVVIVVHVALR